jgi:hypothetical protein
VSATEQRPQKELEAILSDSIDLLRRNLNPEARGQLKCAIEEYDLFYKHLVDARIALQFNYFLACLDQHDAPDYQEILYKLVELFNELTEATTTSLEVSRQLSLLVHNSSLDIDEELRLRLTDLLERDFLPPQRLKDPRFILEAHISPFTIAQLGPIDSGLLCYTLAKQSMSIVTLPSWMRKIYRAQIKTPQLPQDVKESLTLFTNFYHEKVYDEAYEELLYAFEWAVYCAPIFAFEWVIGLVRLERFGSVENLAYLHTLPLERRVTLTIKMHRDFAALLADERDAERLALHHWQEVISLSQHHLKVIEHRQRERATHQNEDMETQGWLKVRIAEGLIAQGDDLHAQKLLDIVSSKARIDTFRDPILSATALSLSGMVHERLGKLEDASTDYYNALNRAIPCPILSYEDVLFLENWTLEREDDYQRLTLILVGIKRSCDLIRLTNHSEALSDLDLLHLLLTNLAHRLPYEPYLEAQIYLGLTYAHLEETDGAKRSLEAAQALDHITGIALSNLFLLRAWKRELSLQSDQPAKLRPQYERVLKEVEGARGGEIQRQLQLHSTLLFLQANLPQYHKMSDNKRVALGKKIEVLLKKTYDSFCQRALRSHLCQFSLLLPKISDEELEGQLKVLLTFPEFRVAARWLVKVIKENDHPYYFISPKRELSQIIKDEHCRRFEVQWIDAEELPTSSFKMYDQLISRRDTPSWPQRSLNAQEARLEYFIFEDWLLVYLVTQDQQVLTHQVNFPREELEHDVHELLKYLLSPNEPQYLLNETSLRLYSLLLGPFSDHLDSLHRLVISPSDILNLLPFSVLIDEHGRYLGEKVELAISLSTADPVFTASSIPRGHVNIHHITSSDDHSSPLIESLAHCVDPRRDHHFSIHSPNVWTEEHAHLIERGEIKKGATIVTFDGEIGNSGGIIFTDDSKHIEISMSQAVRSLVYTNASCCLLTQNLSPYIVPQKSIRTLLTSLHGGLVHCRWQGAYFNMMMEKLIGRLTEGSLLVGMMGALTHLRRTAIQERHHPKEWACFELYVAQHQLE